LIKISKLLLFLHLLELVDDLEEGIHAYGFLVSQLVEFSGQLVQQEGMLVSFWLTIDLFSHHTLPELTCTLNEDDGEFLPSDPAFGEVSIHRPLTLESESQHHAGEGEEPAEAIDQNEQVIVVGVNEEG
jgi:hypothetical protein